jgi:RND family efflux transporter MFP subunit
MVAVAICLAMALSSCKRGPEANARGQGPQAMPVKVEVIRNVPVTDSTDYVATLKSRESAAVMPQVEGVITEIYVHSGARVASGMPLMQIDPSKQQATVKSQQDARAAQEANVTFAKQQYDRASGLYAAGVVSKQDLDQARTALDAAQAQLRSLEAQVNEQQVQLHYYKVDAPRSGIVGDIPVRVGDKVAVTTLLTTVDKPGTLEAYVYVPVERSSQLRRGLPVQLVDSQGKVIADSRISFISPQVDNTTQTVLVKATIANNEDKLRNAQFIRARVVWRTQSLPLVPVLSVTRIGDQFFVFVAEAGQNGSFVARQRPLRIGQTVANDYAVLDGLKPGERVVVSSTQFLVDGMPVLPQT